MVLNYVLDLVVFKTARFYTRTKTICSNEYLRKRDKWVFILFVVNGMCYLGPKTSKIQGPNPLPLALVMDMHASKTLCTGRGKRFFNKGPVWNIH
jgi:hypothetical protein